MTETQHTLLDDAAGMLEAHGFRAVADQIAECKKEIPNMPLSARSETHLATDDGGITQALVQMARENAIEECAKQCEVKEIYGSFGVDRLSWQCAAAIRALKNAAPPGPSTPARVESARETVADNPAVAAPLSAASAGRRTVNDILAALDEGSISRTEALEAIEPHLRTASSGAVATEARRLAILECSQMVNGRLAGREEGSALWLEIIKITNMLERHSKSIADDGGVSYQEALSALPAAALKVEGLPDFIRKRIEQACHEAENPKGMTTGMGLARVQSADIRRLLALLDRSAQSAKEVKT